jgi:hypothetical protein
MDALPILFIFLVAALIIGGIVYSYLASQQRKKDLAAFAAAWGFAWDDDDPFGIEDRYEAFSAIDRGHGRYAYNVFHGDRHDRAIICFDYRYKTGSGKEESTHHFSGALIGLGVFMPRLSVRPEGLLDKLAAAVGFDDIDFESAEFSRLFYVKSDNRKFAYDVLHARAMEYMLALPRRFTMEFIGDTALVHDDRTWDPAEFDAAVRQVEGLIELFPEYLRRALKEGTL